MSKRADRSSSTAEYVAAVRTILTQQGVIDDPWAAPMLGPAMRRTVAALRLPGLRRWTRSPFFAALAARIAWFDTEVVRALDDGIGQVVVVGAGYDSRAWRLVRDRGRCYEVDHPVTQADKRRRAPVGPHGPTYVPCDLSITSPIEALVEHGFHPAAPAVFVVEGVLMYLTEEEVRHLLSALAAGAAPGSRLAANFGAPPGTGGLVERVRQPLIRLTGRAGGEAHRSFADRAHAREVLDGTGWQVDRVDALRDVAPTLVPDTELQLHRINPDAVAVAAHTSPAS